MTISRGVNGVARNIFEQQRGVNGVARTIREEWRGVSGVARRTFTSNILPEIDYLEIPILNSNIYTYSMDNNNNIGDKIATGYNEVSNYADIVRGVTPSISIRATKTNVFCKIYFLPNVVLKNGAKYTLHTFFNNYIRNESVELSITSYVWHYTTGYYRYNNSVGTFTCPSEATYTIVFSTDNLRDYVTNYGHWFSIGSGYDMASTNPASCTSQQVFNSFKITDSKGTVYNIPIRMTTDF